MYLTQNNVFSNSYNKPHVLHSHGLHSAIRSRSRLHLQCKICNLKTRERTTVAVAMGYAREGTCVHYRYLATPVGVLELGDVITVIRQSSARVGAVNVASVK